MEKTFPKLCFIVLLLLLPWCDGCKRAALKERPKPASDPVQVVRLGSRLVFGDKNPYGRQDLITASGVWVPDSANPQKALFIKQQVAISCIRNSDVAHNDECVELITSFAIMGGTVVLSAPSEVDFKIAKWGDDGVTASSSDEKCAVQHLFISVPTDKVSVTDAPTHAKGCEAINEQNSYNLVNASYQIDLH